MKSVSKHTWYILGVIAIAFFSFTQFAPVYFNRYTSDNAIHVLMASRFDFPTDLYYWGQDRLGSILPMLASIPVKLFGFSPIWCVSIVQFLLLFFGFFFFSTFLKNYFLKILFCLFWFFPLQPFDWHMQIGQPYSGQFFFLGLSVYLIGIRATTQTQQIKNKILFLASGLSFMLSVWVSDLSTFTLPFFLFYVFSLFCASETESGKIKIVFDKHGFVRGFIPLMAGMLLGYLFIKLAKANATHYVKEYDILFSSVSHIQEGFSGVFNLIGKSFSFQVRNVLISIQTVLVGIIVILFLFSSINGNQNGNQKFGFRLFLIGSVVFTFIMVVASYWVELNHYDSRYFSFTYILFFVFIFVCADGMIRNNLAVVSSIILALAVVVGCLNSIIGCNVNYTDTKNLSAKEINDISKKLGKCSLIGDYWSSYNLASVRPDLIKASTWDYYATRDTAIIASLMSERNIYLVGNNWLDTFPDFRNDFGYFLVKAGDPFSIDQLNLCRYKVVQEVSLLPDKAGRRNMHLTGSADSYALIKDDSTRVNDFIVFGPWLNLKTGKFNLNFDLACVGNNSINDSLTIDLTHDFGKSFYARELIVIRPRTTLSKKQTYEFTTDSLRRNFELRIYFKGKSNITIGNLKLKQL